MEIALKQRDRLESSRKREKLITKDKYSRRATSKKVKGLYRNIKSKIRHSVQKDRTK